MSNIRIYINKEITKGFVVLDKAQSHYIKNVMRLNQKVLVIENMLMN